MVISATQNGTSRDEGPPWHFVGKHFKASDESVQCSLARSTVCHNAGQRIPTASLRGGLPGICQLRPELRCTVHRPCGRAHGLPCWLTSSCNAASWLRGIPQPGAPPLVTFAEQQASRMPAHSLPEAALTAIRHVWAHGLRCTPGAARTSMLLHLKASLTSQTPCT